MHTAITSSASILRALVLLGMLLPQWVSAQQPETSNSNFWPVYSDKLIGFRISYPPNWIQTPPRGPNVKFSVSPTDGPGNCNVVAKPNAELARMSQSELNLEIRTLGIDVASWAGYVGSAGSNVRLISARRAAINSIPAIIGILDIDLENLQGKYVRRQIVAMTFTPSAIWTINCGASVENEASARRIFEKLSTTFEKVLGSFAFSPKSGS